MVPGANKIEVINALNGIAVDNIENLGTCFLFASHNDLQVARRNLRDPTIAGKPFECMFLIRQYSVLKYIYI